MNALRRVSTLGLTKIYGGTRALVDATLAFEPGVTVIEGPNGSGKTTLLSLLAQTARPTAGHIEYDGKRLRSTAIRASLGVVSHDAMLYPDLTGRENLEFFAELYRVPSPQTRIDALRERFSVGRYIERAVRTYSRGQIQRVALCRALLHAPSLVLLDEPTNGLDRASLDRLAEVVDEERRAERVIVMVTHDREFATRVADRIVALRGGRVQAEETVASATEGGAR